MRYLGYLFIGLITFYLAVPAPSAVSGLQAKIMNIPGWSQGTSAPEKAINTQKMDTIIQVLETVLYKDSGKEKAASEGRVLFKDLNHGTITVVDTRENLQKAANYLGQLKSQNSTGLSMQSQLIPIRHADPDKLRNTLNQILQEQRSGSGANPVNPPAGNVLTGTIIQGADNGLSMGDIHVNLVEIIGNDTTNNQAKLYLYTPQRDRDVTLSKGSSELMDYWRVRVLNIDPVKQEVEIEIRTVGR